MRQVFFWLFLTFLPGVQCLGRAHTFKWEDDPQGGEPSGTISLPGDEHEYTFDMFKSMNDEFSDELLKDFWESSFVDVVNGTRTVKTSRTESCMASPIEAQRKSRKPRKHHVPALLHQMGPKNTSRWEKWITTWNKDKGIKRRFYRDDDLPAIIKDTVPHLYQTFVHMGHWVEKADFARYAVLYRDGGIYADLDMELADSRKLRDLMAKGKAILPFEKKRLVGQAIMISPPKHPFMLEAMEYLAQHYNACCYAVANTGPDALTNFWNKNGACGRWKEESVELTVSILDGPVAKHHQTGSWRDKDQLGRRLGMEGCKFHRVLCSGCKECAH